MPEQAPPLSLEGLDADTLYYRWLTAVWPIPPAASAPPSCSTNCSAWPPPRAPAPHLVPRAWPSFRNCCAACATTICPCGDLSRLLSQDVVLVAEVIRGANSPYYSPNAPIKTIESAVMLLGQNGMRLLLARGVPPCDQHPDRQAGAPGRAARLAPRGTVRPGGQSAGAAPARQSFRILPGLTLMLDVGLIVAFRLF
ncbi:HDOD domain-containing protein [Massilia sp. B-10]|nr:HDOD domain-containing protein [Massilia sp. B-10]